MQIYLKMNILNQCLKNTNIKLIVMFFLSVPIYISYSSLVSRRLHDLNEGESKINSLRYSLPIVGELLTFDKLIFKQGCKSKNKYGDLPKI